MPVRTFRPPKVRDWQVASVLLLAIAIWIGVLVWNATRPPITYGTLVATVTLPDNGGCSVGGTFDGINYVTIQSGCFSNVLQVYRPPFGDGPATLVTAKRIIDPVSNQPVMISAVAWDPKRQKLWGAMANAVYLIDPGEGAEAVATFQFIPGVLGSYLVDGLAYDPTDDTLYYAPDSNPNVYHFSLGGGNEPLGTLMNILAPKNPDGQTHYDISGIVVGAGDTLYIGRNGGEVARIDLVDKNTGEFISSFATTFERVEDLTCDPSTHAAVGKDTILAKDAFNALYEAFEAEPGTCMVQDSASQIR